jgi:spore coat polysaccharide biosynthesis protein SpsF
MSLTKIAIIQARMSSSRLPGKVMLDIDGQPMLQRVFKRAKKATLVDQVVVATTHDPSDDILEGYCRKRGIPCYRGSLRDVLDRFYQSSLQYQADIVIRLTADCPLLDPQLLDLTLLAFLGNFQPGLRTDNPLVADSYSPGSYPLDFCANRLPPPWPRTLPIGLDVEVCSFEALKNAWQGADQPYQREHVMPYLYEGLTLPTAGPLDADEWFIQQAATPRGFKVAVLQHNPDFGSLRWTVDTPADLEFVRQVYAHFKGQDDFNWKSVLVLLDQKPELATINSEVAHKSAFDVDHRNLPA